MNLLMSLDGIRFSGVLQSMCEERDLAIVELAS